MQRPASLVLILALWGCDGPLLGKDPEGDTDADADADTDTDTDTDADADADTGGQVELPDPFSIVLLPDTQYYTEKLPDDPSNTYYLQARWIIDHQASENILMAVHLGDITDNNESDEWRIASQAHAMLDAAGVPNCVLPGNHDYKDGSDWSRGSTAFGDWFGADRYAGQPWYGGSYDSSNTNNWVTFQAGELRFLVLSLEYAPRKDQLCWAEEVIAAHPDHRVIIATHCYLTRGGSYATSCPSDDYDTVGSDGQSVWDELASRHSNVVMVVAGHNAGSEHRASTGNCGNPVHELLVDYQFEGTCGASGPEGCTNNCRTGTYTGNGWLRLLTFDPRAGLVHAETITVHDGDASVFAGGSSALYCSPLFQGSGSGGNYYEQDPTHAEHRFDFALDLAAPLVYAYDDNGMRAFIDRTVNSASSGDQASPELALSADGSFVAAWEDDSSSADGSGNLDVLIRGFAPCGCESFADLAPSGDTSGDQREPALAADGRGNFVVAWADDTDDNGVYQVHARGFDASGAEIIPEFTVNSVGTGDQRDPAVAMAADGRFFIAWEDDQDRDGDAQILMRGFAADGSEIFADTSVHDDNSGERIQPSLAVDGSGNVVVAWQDDSDGNGSYQIHARGFTASGAARYSRVVVNSVAAGQQRNPSVGAESTGGFVVTWEDDQEADGDYQILARSFSAGGSALTEWTVASGGTHRHPDLSMAPGGAFAITWQADGDGNGTYQIKASSWDSGGAAWRADQTVNREASGQQTEPAVGLADDGTMVVLWTDDMDNNGVGQILAAGFDAP
jgi:hypothetical protein